MDYANSYKKISTLADQIRAEVEGGSRVGLVARRGQKAIQATAAESFQRQQASYMNTIRKMFSSLKEEKAKALTDLGAQTPVTGREQNPRVGGMISPEKTGKTNTNADYIRQGLIDRGMEPHVAEGFVLNYMDESGLNTSASGDSGSAFGLAQWRGDRLEQLKALAAKKGVDPSDTDVQLDHTVWEIFNTESEAGKKILSAKTVGEAANAIVQYYERPAKEHLIARQKKYSQYED